MRAALFWVKPGLVLIKRPPPEKRGILAKAHFHVLPIHMLAGPLLTLHIDNHAVEAARRHIMVVFCCYSFMLE